MSTLMIGEYRQQDGWHVATWFGSRTAAREWCARVDDSEGHHHARRWRRVRMSSAAAQHAFNIAARGEDVD